MEQATPISEKDSMYGIYFLIKGSTIVYVGQTTQGLSRTFAHIKTKDFNKYYFFPCEKNLLSSLESAYILKFKPKYNKILVYNSTSSSFISIDSIKRKFKELDIENNKTVLRKYISDLRIKIILFDGRMFLNRADMIKLKNYIITKEK